MEAVINKVLKNQIKNKNILKQEKEIYEYAYNILIEESINIVISFIIALIFRQLKLIVYFLCSYIPLRRFSGGYHAEDWKKCRIVSTLIIFCLCILANTDTLIFLTGNSFSILIFFDICILILSPVDSVNKRLSDSERKEYCSRTIKRIIVQMLIFILGTVMKIKSLCLGIVYSHMILLLMLVLGCYKNHKIQKK